MLRLALPDGPDVRGRIGVLLQATRAGLPDIVPLTSPEEQMAGGGRGPHGTRHTASASTGDTWAGDLP